MKIIFSRKGFDSGYGGYPSPILPDGRLISLPIPDFSKDIMYKDLKVNENTRYSNIMNELFGTRIRFENNGRVEINEIGCHFDPDINFNAYERLPGWKPIFGQAGSSLSHLRNQGVGVGDIFLFFGWFRDTEIVNGKLQYSKMDKQGKHIIFGYLQIGEVQQINSMQVEKWMKYHPHVTRGASAKDDDFLYIANEKLNFDSKFKGAGMLKYSKDTLLTKDGMSRTKWDLPDIFRGNDISYHTYESWKDGYFQSAAKGQEFVVEATKEIKEWVNRLIKTNID